MQERYVHIIDAWGRPLTVVSIKRKKEISHA